MRGGRAGPVHKNACVMMGVAEGRNALHNPNTVGAGPQQRWQPFLPIYFSSLSTQSPALSAALSIPGKMKSGPCFYLWLEISMHVPEQYLHPEQMKSKTSFTQITLFIQEKP